MPARMIKSFLQLESAGGIILILAALAALLFSNSPLAALYADSLATPFTIALGDLALSKPVLLWINDGFMAVFFLLIGLELKREILEGQLSSRDQIALPTVAAIGGMAIPALIFVGFNWGEADNISGWAIPSATDIAFALGIMALLGNRVPLSLKILLTAIAIIDDLGAIVIIALFYTAELSVVSLALAAVALIGLFILNRVGVTAKTPYILVGIVLWVCVLKSGVHATLAGVAIGFAIPLKGKNKGSPSPLCDLEHSLHPWVAFMILPIFAFANAGVSLAGITFQSAVTPLTLGIAAGLFFGKQIGVFGFTWLAVKTKICRLPEDLDWRHIYGLSLLTGIGFTMSLFIGGLAYEDPALGGQVRIGVLSGSLVAALSGYFFLKLTLKNRKAPVN
ncbi:Na+/H+ antiporter NhaA [Kiloniella laminariae]|uniref:Na+/H+ antiporter NhaA n=1 Tax=Kiloniella laminariae TaxID=454162 RepID=UPI00036476CD|nr:Na+/H+ antiporter NhaA [Kiloniella laminariae]